MMLKRRSWVLSLISVDSVKSLEVSIVFKCIFKKIVEYPVKDYTTHNSCGWRGQNSREALVTIETHQNPPTHFQNHYQPQIQNHKTNTTKRLKNIFVLIFCDKPKLLFLIIYVVQFDDFMTF